MDDYEESYDPERLIPMLRRTLGSFRSASHLHFLARKACDALELLQRKAKEARISLEHGEWDNAKEELDDALRGFAGDSGQRESR